MSGRTEIKHEEDAGLQTGHRTGLELVVRQKDC